MIRFRLALTLFLAMALTCSNITSSVEAKEITYYEDRVAVLMYHHIDPNFKSSATIKPELFEDQIEYLVNAGYNFISMEQLELFLYKGEKVPKNSILITFDDGYRSYLEYAYPILQQYQIPSTNFIIGECTNAVNGLSRLTSADMQEMAEDSLVDLQSHTYSLHQKTNEQKPFLTTPLNNQKGFETKEEYYSRIKTDLQNNKVNIEGITGKRIYSFAFPYGAYNYDSIKALKETGHTLAFTINKGMTEKNSNPFLLPRINAGNPDITPQKLHDSILVLNTDFKAVISEKALTYPDIYIDNRLINFPEQKPFVQNGMTYVPIRVISDEFGARVDWDSKSQKAKLTTKNNEIYELSLSEKVKKGEDTIYLDASPILYVGTYMVPIRTVEKIFDATVCWDGINKKITINLKGERK